MQRVTLIALVVGLVVASRSFAAAPDPLLPASGEFSASLATGIPFLAIGEVSIGIGDSFAVGVVAGLTPVVEGVGVRLRGALLRHERVSLLFDMPFLYYPDTESRGAWFLTRPALLLDYRIGERAHVQAGFGVIATMAAANTWPHIIDGTWQTARVGCIIPISDHLSFFGDAGVVLDGIALAGKEWGGGPPFTLTLGVTWMF